MCVPRHLTSFVGREQDVAAVCHLLRGDETRLVTLTGPGGVGKTRLAIQAAAEVSDAFPDGVWFVPLAALRDPGLVVATIARAVGVWDALDHSAEDAIAAFLRNRNVLLILDNFEQVLSAAPRVVDLLAACPRAKVLVTSRTLLRVSGEYIYPVPPLAVPAPKQPAAVARLAEVEAVRLFIARARAAKPEFVLSVANAADVAAICRQLDGLPLAIELVAAKTRILPPAALRNRLERRVPSGCGTRLPVLTGGARDQPARLQTMRDAIAWSHDLLAPEEQILFRRLAVFAGGFTLEAAEAVAGLRPDDAALRRGTPSPGSVPSPQSSVLDALSILHDQSLLRPVEQPGSEPRFGMLETVREYALERLAASGEAPLIHRAHVAWCLDLAERAEPRLYSVEAPVWAARLDAEHANLQSALAWATDYGEAETGLRLAGALFWFWMTRHADQGRTWLERCLAAGGTVSPAVRAQALLALAVLAWRVQEDDERAEPLLEEALAIRRRLGDRRATAEVVGHFALASVRRGDLDRAATLATEGLALARAVDDAVLVGGCLASLAFIARGRGDDDGARACLDEALASLRRSGFRWGTAWILGHLANLARERGALAEAIGRYGESAALYHEDGGTWDTARALVAAAIAATDAGQFAVAARLFGAAEARCEAIGAPPCPDYLPASECAVAAARDALGDAAFAAAWSAGRALPMAELIGETAAVAAALAPAGALPGGLSVREAEVLRLVAAGLSNPAIADRLHLSSRTVQAHLRAVYRKLGVATRGQAACFAREHDLA